MVVTGVSGSGKSSLAFDTLYAEGQRRYIESLSAYARQFLGQMEKPLYDSIKGLAPTISIEQKTASTNPRSTVGTVTEIHDYLRVLWARVGRLTCHRCGRPVSQQSAQQIVHEVMELAEGTKFLVLAPLVKERKGEHRDVIEQVRKAGFTRVRVDGIVLSLDDDPIQLDKKKKHTIDAVVDRLVAKPGLGVPPDRRRRDRAAARRGHRRGRRRGRQGPGALRAPRVPPLRHLVPGADAAAVLLQLAAGHVPGVLGPRHAHGDGPRAGGAQPRAVGQRGRRQAARGRRRGDHLGQRHRARGGARARDRPQQALEGALRGAAAGDPLRHRRRARQHQAQELVGLGRLQDALRGRHQLDDAPHARDEVGGDAAVLPEVPVLASLLRLRRAPHPRRGARREDRRAARSRRSRRSRSPTPSPSSTRSRSREPRRRSPRSCSRRSARGCASCSTWGSTT